MSFAREFSALRPLAEMKSLGRSGVPILAMALLEACATAQLHSEDQLNQVAVGCGLSVGDVVQESEERRLLFLYRIAPKPQQRHCVYEWARRNHLTLVTINAVNEAPGPHS